MNNPYFKNLKTVVYDIETSGLSFKSNPIISVTFCYPETGELVQLFSEHPRTEGKMLRDCLDILSEADVVVGYNSDAFDNLYVLNRARLLGVADRLPFNWSVDLYKWLKKYWPVARTMPHLRQKDVEYALGISEERTDRIDGGECIPLYNQWLAFGDEEARDKILLHNGDDVRQLAEIYNRINFLPWHEIAFSEGFLIADGILPIKVSSGALKGNSGAYRAILAKGLMPASIYTDQYHLEYNSFTGEALLEFNLEKKGDYRFLDLQSLGIEDPELAEIMAMPGCRDGFLVASEGKNVNYMELNALARMFFKRL